MNWQDIAALTVVAAAVTWLVASRLRRRRRAHSCGSCPTSSPAPGRTGSIVFQARRGERPVITVKMK